MTLDAGVAALVGAAVGALASLGAGLLNLVPGISETDRQATKERRAEVRRLIVDIQRLFGDAALHLGDEEGIVSLDRARQLLFLRTELGVVLTAKESGLLALFDECLEGVKPRRTSDAAAVAAGHWGTAAPDWYRGEESSRSLKKIARLTKESIESTGTPT